MELISYQAAPQVCESLIRIYHLVYTPFSMFTLGDVVTAPFRYGYKAYRGFKEWRNPPLSKRTFKGTRKEHITQPTASGLSSVSSGPLFPNNKTVGFLRLPFELRRQIYSHLFVDRFIIYLDVKPRGRTELCLTQSHVLYSARSEMPERIRSSSWDWTRVYLEQRALPGHGVVDVPSDLIEGLDKPLDIGLLRTCRQIYQEGTALFYGTNTFDIANLEHLLYLNQTVPSYCMANIRYLQLKTALPTYVYKSRSQGCVLKNTAWPDAWELIANQMTALRELSLTVDLGCAPWEEQKSLLAAVGQVRGLTAFVLNADFYFWFTRINQWDERREFREELSRKVKLPRGGNTKT